MSPYFRAFLAFAATALLALGCFGTRAEEVHSWKCTGEVSVLITSPYKATLCSGGECFPYHLQESGVSSGLLFLKYMTDDEKRHLTIWQAFKDPEMKIALRATGGLSDVESSCVPSAGTGA